MKGKRYTATEIAKASKVNRQTIRNFMNESPDQINVHTIAGLLDFFAAEGMPVTINDLFTIESTSTVSESPTKPSAADN